MDKLDGFHTSVLNCGLANIGVISEQSSELSFTVLPNNDGTAPFFNLGILLYENNKILGSKDLSIIIASI